jgi:hypothetical protein
MSWFQLAKIQLTIFSSTLSNGAKYLKSGAVTAVRSNRFPVERHAGAASFSSVITFDVLMVSVTFYWHV